MPTLRSGLWTIGVALWVECIAAPGAKAFLTDAPAALAVQAPRGESEVALPTSPREAVVHGGRESDRLRASDLVRAAMPCLRTVLAGARFGVSDQETAAWLVADPRTGEFSCRLWPPIAKRGEARWTGAMPRGVVAQIHSHPTRAASGRQWTPRPSQNDCRIARELAVPVLTVSLEGVYECRPADGRIVPLLGAGWEQVAEGGNA